MAAFVSINDALESIKRAIHAANIPEINEPLRKNALCEWMWLGACVDLLGIGDNTIDL